jgi:glycosyltransferase involved in cell wall biosynthesis
MGFGGKERRLVELMKEIKTNPKFDFELAIMNTEIDYHEVFALNIKIHYLIRKTKKDLSVFFKLYKICKKYKPDIIHCWDIMTAIYSIPASWLLNIKLINGMVVDYPIKKSIFNKHWFRAKLTFFFSSAIVGNSKSGLSAYRTSQNKSFIVYNGYNFNRNNHLAEKASIKRQLDIHTEYMIAMVASFSEFKDYKTYYRAANIILEKRNDVTFLAIGTNTDSSGSKKLVRGQFENHFRLLGKKSGIESIVNAIDVGVLATYTEGISNSIMEYMALGKPVIATSGGGTYEIVEDNKTGFLVKTSDAEELASKIDLLLNDSELRARMGETGQERIRNFFTIDTMVKKYILLYEGIAKHKT